MGAQFQFYLTPQQATDIASNRDIRMGSKLDYLYQVQLRFCPLDPSAEQGDEFPPSICVQVNGKCAPCPTQSPPTSPMWSLSAPLAPTTSPHSANSPPPSQTPSTSSGLLTTPRAGWLASGLWRSSPQRTSSTGSRRRASSRPSTPGNSSRRNSPVTMTTSPQIT